MSKLNLTPNRLALLAAVKDGRVRYRRSPGYSAIEKVNPTGIGSKVVTKAAGDLEEAGLIRRGSPVSPSYFADRPYELTNAGREALEGSK